MCHWVLRIWKCGDSYFTKYSSCSFDRAAHDPNNLLNPLHPSITPFGVERAMPQVHDVDRPKAGSKYKSSNKSTRKGKHNGKPRTNTNNRTGSHASLPQPILSPVDSRTPRMTPATIGANGAEPNFARDARTGEIIPVPLSEIGKASRFGDKTLGDSTKCNVFEVVLQSKEPTVCPACARSPKRARLPAHARGCFGLS